MSTTPYRKAHVLDFNIEDENAKGGRDITISVDTLEMVNIEVGSSVTIRTDEEGVDELRDALHRALTALENIRYSYRAEDSDEDDIGESMARLQEKLEGCGVIESSAEDEMIQSGIDAREKLKTKKQMKDTASPKIDVYGDYYDPNDPVNW